VGGWTELQQTRGQDSRAISVLHLILVLVFILFCSC